MRVAYRLVAPVLCVAFAGCVALGHGERPLRVGTSGDYAPFSRAGEGFDVEVARALARDLGVRIEWVRFRWPELAHDVSAGRFDVAMSGVTWRPDRAVLGEMTRAVAQGGPCVIGAAEPERLGVNRGGFLARFAKREFPGARIVEVDQNLALPELLASGRVDAILTDSFELRHFLAPGQPARCLPAHYRKVYWVTPAAPPGLAARIDTWMAGAEPELQALRARFFGEPAVRDELDHLIDLLARRIELMPEVARYKRGRGLPIRDSAREQTVLDAAAARGQALGLAAEPVRALFALQIELAKRVQERGPVLQAGRPLDLATELRPALLRLGERILVSLAELRAPLDWPPAPERTAALRLHLNEDEIGQLMTAIRGAARPLP